MLDYAFPFHLGSDVCSLPFGRSSFAIATARGRFHRSADEAGDKDDFSDDERDQLDNDGRDGSRKRPAAGDDDDDAVTEAAYLAQVKSLMGTLSGPGPLGGGGHQNALQPWVNRYGPTFRSLAGLLTAFVQDESKHRVTVHMKDDRILVGTIIAVDEHMK